MAASNAVDDHPLWRELATLSRDVARYQDEAHSASVKLQRHVVETSQIQDENQALQRQNVLLSEEVAALRVHQGSASTPASQVAELTLALRHLSEKLTATEQTVLERTGALADALSENAIAKRETEGVRALARSALAREDALKAELRRMERQVLAAEQGRNMADFVVHEYADLVRKLNDERHQRQSADVAIPLDCTTSAPASASHADPSENFGESTSGLQRLLGEFISKVETLELEISRLHDDLAQMEIQREAYKQSANEERARVVTTTTELERHKREDDTAAKMVSRYMQFSQASTDALQNTIESLKARHAATHATHTSQIGILQRQLHAERHYTSKLRAALDDMTKDISRETFGRRREVSLRLALIVREEWIAESLRRWAGRVLEFLKRAGGILLPEGLRKILADAEDLIETIDGEILHDHSFQTLGRIITAEHAAASLAHELQVETDRRLGLERQMADLQSAAKETWVASTPSMHPLPRKDDCEQRTRINGSSDSIFVRGSTLAGSRPKDLSINDNKEEPPIVESAPICAPISTLVDAMGRSVEKGVGSVAKTHSTSQVSEGQASRSMSTPSIQFSQTRRLESEKERHFSVDDQVGHPLLARLRQIKHRYDDLQRSFRACHLALVELKRGLNNDIISSPSAADIRVTVLQTVVGRLDDFSEDVRVELEICIIDEERLARGYETLLAIPIALAQEGDQTDTLRRIEAFVDGSDKGVHRSLHQFANKCSDLEHDIAAVKRFMHTELAEKDPSPHRPRTNSFWSSSWSNLLSPPSRPPSPIPAPTFGSVMTSPRLRHTSSQAYLKQGTPESLPEKSDPYAALGLRIGMPEVGYNPPPRARLLTLSKPPMGRPRTSSALHFLGFTSEVGLLSDDATAFPAADATTGTYSEHPLENPSDVE